MKKLFSIIGLIGLATPLLAAKISDSQLELGKESSTDNKEILFNIGEGTGNPKIRANYGTKKLEFTNDGTNFLEFGSGGESGAYNIIDNAGFESDLTNWTNTGSGSLSVDTDAADVYQGQKSALWDAAAASDILASEAVTIPGGLRGNLCSVEVQYKGGDDNLKLQAYDGTNVLAEVALEASANFSKAMVTFTCPNSGTIQGRIIASADAAAVNVDNWVVGKSADILNYSASSEWQDWTPSYAGSASMTFTSVTTYVARYRVVGNGVEFYLHFEGTTGGTANEYISASLPINAADDSTSSGVGPYSFSVQYQNGVASTLIPGSGMIFPLGGVTQLRIGRQDNTDFGLGTNREFIVTGFYEIDPNDAPLNVNPIQRVETSAWNVAARVGFGDVLSLSVNDTAQTIGSRSSRTIEENTGSIPAKLMCDGAVPGTDSCPSSNGLMGIAFEAPRAGAAYICVEGQVRLAENSGISDVNLELTFHKVPVDGSVSAGALGTTWTSIQQVGNTRVQQELSQAVSSPNTYNTNIPFSMCGITNLNAGLNGFVGARQLTYAYGSVSSNDLFMNRWTVFPIEQQLPQALITQGRVYTKKCNDVTTLAEGVTTDLNCSLYLPAGRYWVEIGSMMEVTDNASPFPTFVTGNLALLDADNPSGGNVAGLYDLGLIKVFDTGATQVWRGLINWQTSVDWNGGEVFLYGDIDENGGIVNSRHAQELFIKATRLD